ncbi:MAG TPA: dihydroorotase [Pirellulales bacterium]
MDKIVVDAPLDMHVHLRQDALLRVVTQLTYPTWAGVMAMPNTNPPITTVEQLAQYRAEILAAVPQGEAFEPYLTLYFQTSYTRDFLALAKPHILSIKFYPRNLTTNSHHGCDPGDPAVYDVMAAMEELGIPLSVHPEAEGYYHDREELFGRFVERWVVRFPRLKIILEHLSDRKSIPLLKHPNVFATVTPQHFLTNGNDWFGPPFNPHLYCMPCVKRPEDAQALLQAATNSSLADKFMAGTDSAPHVEDRKVSCGCAGVFTAPIALQLYAQAFDGVGAIEKLPAFLGGNARRIYGVTPPKKKITLVRKPYAIPERYDNGGSGQDLIPMWAGRTIDWSVE